MAGQHTVYFKDEEENLQQWVEDHADVFGGKSSMYKRAMIIFREEKGEEIESLSGHSGLEELT